MRSGTVVSTTQGRLTRSTSKDLHEDMAYCLSVSSTKRSPIMCFETRIEWQYSAWGIVGFLRGLGEPSTNRWIRCTQEPPKVRRPTYSQQRPPHLFRRQGGRLKSIRQTAKHHSRYDSKDDSVVPCRIHVETAVVHFMTSIAKGILIREPRNSNSFLKK